MTPDALGQQLHHRATRGETLSAEEQSLLDAWYARLDAEEAVMFAQSQPKELKERRDRLHASLARIIDMTERLSTLNAENERLRQLVLTHLRQLVRDTVQPV